MSSNKRSIRGGLRLRRLGLLLGDRDAKMAAVNVPVVEKEDLARLRHEPSR